MKYIIDNLLTLITGDDGKLKDKYMRFLPNISYFKHVTAGKAIHLENMSINKSVTDHVELEQYKNGKINRYLKHQQIRLLKMLFNPPKFWMIAEKLIRRSRSFFVTHLDKIEPRWHRDLPVWTIFQIWRRWKRIKLDFKGNVDFKRVYIPKYKTSLEDWAKLDKKTWRPLGVPTLEWRLYLSMLNTILVIWLEPTWEKQQHGYFPQKGSLTAWIEILKNIHKDNIYEFDLKSFFPSVQIQYVTKMLREVGTPKWWCEYIENLNKTKPKLSSKDETDETKTREAQDIANGKLNRSQAWYQPVREFIEANGEQIWKELVTEDTGGYDIYHEFEMIQLQHALFSSFKENQTFHGTLQELPQGGGISPILSVLVLKPLFKANPSTIMYADDGVIFDKPVTHGPGYIEAGIEFSLEKSSWVKRDGKWLKPLKFLGLIYNGETNELSSKTRKGKQLVIALEKAIKITAIATKKNVWSDKDIWLKLFQSKLGGFILASLYSGTLDLATHLDNWEISAVQRSWTKTVAKRIYYKERIKPTLYNGSSIASRWLMNKLRRKRI